MVRASLEHAFVPGASLWRNGQNFTPMKECAADLTTPQMLSATCPSFLNKNKKGQLQWLLESQLRSFESQEWPTAARGSR